MVAARERGIAIVAALWASVIIAVIVASVLQLARADARLGRGRQDAVELAAIADGAVNLAVLAMLGPAAGKWPVNGSPVTVPFAGYDVQVSVQDEAGKIDLNVVGEPTLRQLLAAAGLDAEAARRIAAEIAGPPDDDSGGAASDGQRRRKMVFQSVEDLQLVNGLTPDVYGRLAPLVTVYSQAPWIDPASASPAVLALFSATDATAAAALRRLEEGRQGLGPPSAGPGVALGHAFTITAELRAAAGARVVRSAIIRLTGQPRNPLLVYRWR